MGTKLIYEPRGRAGEYALLAVNLFGGCGHGCTYCYAPAVLRVTPAEFVRHCRPKPEVIKRLSREAPAFSGTDKRVLLCFTCDPYPPECLERRVTETALLILRSLDVPFSVLTKAPSRAARDFRIYGPRDAFGVSLTLLDPLASRRLEPGADRPAARLAALATAHEMGLFTWASIEPVLYPEQSLALIEQAAPSVAHFMLGKLNHDPARERQIDWPAYAVKALAACARHHRSYTVKADLAAELKRVGFDAYSNTDIRTVPR